MRIGFQASAEMRKAKAKLPVPRAYAFVKPVTAVEEQAALQQAYGRVFPTNKVQRSKSFVGRIPNTLNQSIPGEREWNGDQIDPLVASAVLKEKGGWKPYAGHAIRSAIHNLTPTAKSSPVSFLTRLFRRKPATKPITLSKALSKKLEDI